MQEVSPHPTQTEEESEEVSKYQKIGLEIINEIHPNNDGASCSYHRDKLWKLSSSNDYPLQHGSGLDLYVHEDLLEYIAGLKKDIKELSKIRVYQ